MNQPRKSVMVARRLIASVALVPMFATIYLVIYFALCVLGAEPTNTWRGVFADGLWISAVGCLAFTLAPLFSKRD